MSAASEPHALDREYEVTPLELFFDLVFVFAVSQLSRHLLTHLSWRGAIETLVLLLPILTVWSYTSWAATMIRADYWKTQWMVLTVMFLGLFMNAAVTRAFGASGWAFVIPLLLIQLGRTIWTIACSADAFYREHYFRVLVWFTATTPLWIVGANVSPEARVVWWAMAAGVELIGTWLAHPVPGRQLESENVEFNADHMLERCRLFLLIALGETVLTTGIAIAEAPMDLMTLGTGAVALEITVALWALSFGRTRSLIQEHADKTKDPIYVSRYAINALMILVAGLIAIAVANEMIIAHPHERGTVKLSLLLVGGPILFLAGQGWYLSKVLNVRSRLHVIGVIVLLWVGLVTFVLPGYVALFFVGATLASLALFDRL